ncbi:MAG: hypothetical protein WBA73_13590 [Devosia sp.]
MGQNAKLLLINGIILGIVAFLQFGFDFASYFVGIGPMGAPLHGNLDAIGYAEAHGLAAIFAVLFVLRRNDQFAGWHAVAGCLHLLLGTCNVIFWPVFLSGPVASVGGLLATLMHAVFAVLQLWAFVRSFPGTTSRSVVLV